MLDLNKPLMTRDGRKIESASLQHKTVVDVDMLDLTKPMATRSGIRVAYFHLIPKEFNCFEPLVVVLEGSLEAFLYKMDGRYYPDGMIHDLDLINVEE